jgi:hypothetical protein
MDNNTKAIAANPKAILDDPLAAQMTAVLFWIVVFASV